ncbi:MAG TPA: hypothetical protein VFW82_07445 [Dyella sp.]|nr:hypothetical protein [Dyella sp.]
MSIAADEFSASPPSPAARALRWYREAFRLWRRAPLMMVGLCVASLVVEALIQLIPLAGVTVSKGVVPMLAAGVWVGLQRLQQGEGLRFSCLWAGWRQPRWRSLWALCASVGLIVFGFQLACAAAWFGQGAIDAVLLGHMATHRELQTRAFEWVLLLPGMLPSILLAFAMPLFLFRGAGCAQALAGSVRLVSAMPLTFVLAMLPQAALFAVALSNPWALPLLLVVLPIGSLVSFTAWRDVSAMRMAPALDHA